MRAAHPYEPFPLAELEAAVDAAEYPKDEAALNHFGASTRYRRASFACLTIYVWLVLVGFQATGVVTQGQALVSRFAV